jgi:hypothetical protein
MARLDDLDGVAIALDSVIFIYALEGNPEFGELARLPLIWCWLN